MKLVIQQGSFDQKNWVDIAFLWNGCLYVADDAYLFKYLREVEYSREDS